MSSLRDFEKRMASLHQMMECELAERVKVFEGADLETVRREAHKIRGGFPSRPRLTKLAARVEELASAGDMAGTQRAIEALVEEAHRVTMKATPPKEATEAPQGKRILVVDDDPEIRRMLVMTLARMGGFQVEEMEDGAGVMERIAVEPFDLVIVDAMMPGVGGIELALRLRDRTGQKLPVVVLSAASAEELGAAQHGLTWWRKPIFARALLDAVNEIFDECTV